MVTSLALPKSYGTHNVVEAKCLLLSAKTRESGVATLESALQDPLL